MCLHNNHLGNQLTAYLRYCGMYTYILVNLLEPSPNISHLFQPLEDTIKTQLAPALTGRPPPNDAERDLLALPTRISGIALLIPTKDTDTIFRASVKITEPRKVAILQWNPSYTHDIVADQLKAKAETHKLKRQQ